MNTASIPASARQFRGRRFVVPLFRLIGFTMLSGLVFVHARWILPGGNVSAAAAFAAAAIAYSLASWAALSRIAPGRWFDLAMDVLSAVDIVLWTAAIHVTGGPSSWLFMLMFVRSADHVTMGHRRVGAYGLLSAACYLAMLSWQAGPVNWAVEAAKLASLCAINFYIALTARQVDALNQRIRQTQRDLRHARDAAERASKAKSEFLANMSHELRTPLNAVIGYSQLIREGDPGATVEESYADLKAIERAGQHLLLLVNQVLDFAKIESGRMEVFNEKFHAGDVVREVAEVVRPMASKRSNQLVVECAEGVGEVRTDIMKFRQSLLNLMNNACKFTENGEVRVRVSAEGDEHLVVSVADTGIGIAPENLPMLFDAFTQADPSVSRRYGGTGLGLALTKRFARMMGGDVEVASEPNRGSTFTLRLPIAPAEPCPAHPPR